MNDKRLQRIKGIHVFKVPLLVQKEALGLEVETKIIDVPVKLCFPKPSTNILTANSPIPQLIPPSGAEKWEQDGKLIDWGQTFSSEGMSCVNSMAVYVDCSLEKKDEYSQILYKSMEKWEKKLLDYLNLVCRRITRNNKGVYCGLTLYSEHKLMPSNFVCNLSFTIYENNDYISSEQLKKAIAFASSDKTLLPEHEMLLAAFEAKRNNQNRQVVLDACAALELTIIREIKELAVAQGLNPDDIIERQVRMLGKRFDKLKKMDPNCPVESIKDSVSSLRDDMMHGRIVYPTNEEVDRLLSTVEKIVDHYSPANR